MTASSRAVARRAWIAWIIVCLVWGTTYLAIKIALETIPPFLMGGLRYMIAGLGLAAIVRLRGRKLPARETWARLAVLGFLMIGMGNAGVVIGAQWLPSGLTAVLIATNPFWMVTVEAIVTGGQQLFARQWTGLGVGFLGILVLVWPRLTGAGDTHNFMWGVLSVQIACAGWAVGSAYTRRHVMPSDVLGAAAMQMAFGGLLMTVAGTVFGEWSHLYFTSRTMISFIYLTAAGSVVAFAAYSYALRHMDVAIVSLYTYINPIIAVGLGAWLLGESVGWRMAVAAALIATGVFVVAPGKGQRSEVKGQR